MSFYIFLATCLLHGAWGLLLLSVPTDINATPLGLFHALLEAPRLEGGCYLLAALLGSRMLWQRNVPAAWLPVIALPQQILLLLSVSSALMAVLQSQYADGVPRPWPFILADQAPVLIFAGVHAAALWQYYCYGPRWPVRRTHAH